MERTVAITVTYNRTSTLFRCLKSLCEQTVPVYKILVIDNNSRIREKEILKQFADKYDCIDVLWLSENTGGAGGFEAGMKAARDCYDADWYWIMDDDAYPCPDCLEQLLNCQKKFPNVGGMCPLIYGIDLREYQFYHHKRLEGWMLNERQIVHKYEELEDVVQVDANAFVGPLFSRKAVETVGIADGSLFIYGDDTEYTYRVSRKFGVYVVRGAIIEHQDPPLCNNYMAPDAWWKEYYSIRNKYFLIREFKNNVIIRMIAYSIMTLKIFKLMIAAAIKPKYKGYHKVRLKILNMAVVDGLKNRRGKTLDPVQYREWISKKDPMGV